MSQLLEKLRRAAEVFADPKTKTEVSDDEKVVKAKENVVQKVESILKKPHRAAGKLTLSERKFEEKKWRTRWMYPTITPRWSRSKGRSCPKGKRKGCGLQ